MSRRAIWVSFVAIAAVAAVASPAVADDEADLRQIARLNQQGFPVVDYHAHLKGGLTIDELLAHSRQTGIRYGVAPNCGLNFPIIDDAGIDAWLESINGQPVLRGMQAEGREWVTMFSKEAVARFDYVFTDAMTLTDHRGRRTRLWMPQEVEIPDEQAFMERLVTTIVGILNDEPIDIYANPTFLPAVIASRYDALWTTDRMEKVVAAAARNGVAVEINARLRLPSAAFIKLAKSRGVKFSLGTNNGDRNLGHLAYCLEMVKECGLTAGDMFTPKPDGQKPVQLRGFKSRP